MKRHNHTSAKPGLFSTIGIIPCQLHIPENVVLAYFN